MGSTRLRVHLLRSAAIPLLLAVAAPHRAVCEEPSLSIGGTTLTLGMAKESALEQVNKGSYRAVAAGFGSEQPAMEIFLIVARESDTSVGLVTFENAQLTQIKKSWDLTLGESDSSPFVESLFHLLAKLGKEGERVALITTAESHDPAMNVLTIHLDFGNGKRVEIAQIEKPIDGRGAKVSVNLEEVLTR